MENIKLSEKELQELKDLRTKANELVFTLGQLEAKKLSLHDDLKDIKKEQDKIGKDLYEKYGDGEINLAEGEFVKSS